MSDLDRLKSESWFPYVDAHGSSSHKVNAGPWISFDNRPLTSLHNGRHHLIDDGRTVELVRILASDQIAVENDKLLVFCIEDFVQYLNRIDVLLRSPLVPSICTESVKIISPQLGWTYSPRNAGPQRWRSEMSPFL